MAILSVATILDYYQTGEVRTLVELKNAIEQADSLLALETLANIIRTARERAFYIERDKASDDIVENAVKGAVIGGLFAIPALALGYTAVAEKVAEAGIVLGGLSGLAPTPEMKERDSKIVNLYLLIVKSLNELARQVPPETKEMTQPPAMHSRRGFKA